MNRRSLTKSLVTALVLTFISPIASTIFLPEASANTTITKTFTVTYPNGTPYVGALVQLLYTDSADHYSASVATDAQGHAAITIPWGENYVNWEIEPKTGDTSYGIASDSSAGTLNPATGLTLGDNSFASENISVQLSRSTLAVNLFESDGTTQAPSNWYGLTFHGSNVPSHYWWLVRSGPVGLVLPQNMNPGGANFISPYLNTDSQDLNDFSPFDPSTGRSIAYGIAVSGISGSETLSLYTDGTDSALETPDSNGVFRMVYQKPDITGQILDTNGNTISLGADGNQYVYVYNVNTSNDTLGSFAGYAALSSSGNFSLLLNNMSSSKYVLQFSPGENASIPYFATYLYKAPSGGYSLNSQGPFTTANSATPFHFTLRAPAANLKVSYINSTGAPVAGYIWFQDNNNSSRTAELYSSIPSIPIYGSESFALPDSSYTVNVSPSDTHGLGSQYGVVMQNGTPTITNENSSPATQVQPVNGVFNMVEAPVNLNLLAVTTIDSSVIQSVNYNFWYRNADGSQGAWVTGASSANNSSAGPANVYLLPGAYVMEAWQNPNYGMRSFNVDVNAQGVATVQGYAIDATTDATKISLIPANFKFSTPGALINQGHNNAYYDLCQGTSPLRLSTCSGNGIDSSLTAGLTLSPGTYYLRIHPWTTNMAVGQYTINVDQTGAASVQGATQSNGFWVLPGATPNVNFLVLNPKTNSPLTTGWISLGVEDSNGNVTAWQPNADFGADFPGLTQASLPDGKYLVQVNASDSTLGLAYKSYQLTVLNGQPTLMDGLQPISLTAGRFNVSPIAANFLFNLNDAPTSRAIQDGWLDVCADNGGGPYRTGPCSGYGLNNGAGSANLPSGKWYLRVNPGGTELAGPRVYAASVDSSGTLAISGLSAVSGVWTLSDSAPNVSGTFVDVNSNPIQIGTNSNQGVDINLQEADSNGNWQWVTGEGIWRSASNYAFDVTPDYDVTGTKHFRLDFQPQNLGNLTESYSSDFYLTSGGNISRISTTGNDAVPSLTNFNAVLKSPNLFLEVRNPIDNTDLPGGWVAVNKTDPSGATGDVWIGNANIINDGTGLANYYLPDGTYRLEVIPQIGSSYISGLSLAEYKAVVLNGAVTLSLISNGSVVNATNGKFVIEPSASNISGTLLDSNGNVLPPTSTQWLNVNVQYLDSNNNWQYSNQWAYPDPSGNFSLAVNTPGTYRLLLQPNGFATAAPTYSQQFVITSANEATFKLALGNVRLPAPDAAIELFAGSTGPVTTASFNVLENGQWIANYWTGFQGVAGVTFPGAGSYTIQTWPDATSLQNGYTSKNYSVIVSVDSSGHKTLSWASDPGVGQAAGGITTLAFASANVMGTVFLPNSTTPVANSQVTPIDSNGNQLWQYAMSTGTNGRFAMSLPQGTYAFQATAPYGNASVGATDRLGTVTVNSSLVASTSGSFVSESATALSLPLKSPTWSGTLKGPDGSLIAYGQLCLSLINVGTCTQTNGQGQWSFSAPNGFTTFDASAMLQAWDSQGRNFASLNISGASNVSNALGGTSSSGVVLTLPTTNLSVNVTAGGTSVPGSWVNVQANDGWHSTPTNGSGVANFNIPTLNQQLTVSANPTGLPINGVTYAVGNKVFPATSNTIESLTVALTVPNIVGIAHAASSTSSLGAPLPYSTVELDSLDNQNNTQWIGSTQTDINGNFALYADPSAHSNYEVRVYPNGGGTNNGVQNNYKFAITAGGVISSFVQMDSNNPVPTESGTGTTYYDLSLLNPNLSGVVTTPGTSTGAPYSYVQIHNLTSNSWSGAGTSVTGQFGAYLPNGSYQLVAYANNNAYAHSSTCQLTIANAALSNPNIACGASNGSLSIGLHSPNLTMTVLASNLAPITNANIWISVSGWSTGTQTDSSGNAGLYVDLSDIGLNTQGSGTFPINLNIQPNSTQSNLMVQTNCSSGQAGTPCANLPSVNISNGVATFASPLVSLGTVTGKAPNTTLAIKTPTGSAASAGYWVNLFSYDTSTGSNFRYLGGGSTDSNGNVAMNVDTSTSTASTVYGVDIWPGGNDYTLYAPSHPGGYQQANDWRHGMTWAQLIASTQLKPNATNFTATVLLPDGTTPDRYGQVQVSGNNSQQGYGLDYNGVAHMYLPVGTYQIQVYPNGSQGAVTSESVTISNLTPQSVTWTLQAGNVTGTIDSAAGAPVAGAIVVIQVGSDTSTSQTTSTNAQGGFGFNITSSTAQNYTLTVIAPPGSNSPNIVQTVSLNNANIPLGILKFAS